MLLVSNGEAEEQELASYSPMKKKELKGWNYHSIQLWDCGTPNVGIMEEIYDLDVIVLIDCSTTHNFISTSMIELLQLPLHKTTNYKVVIGLGKQLKGIGVCRV